MPLGMIIRNPELILHRPAVEEIRSFRSAANDGYANIGYDINYDGGTDITKDIEEEAENVPSLDKGQENGHRPEHMLRRRSPQDPNAIYQGPNSI